VKKLVAGFVSLALLAAFAPRALAADEKASATGTWKWSFTMGDQTREVTLKLKQDGEKLTGALLGRNNQETAIQDGTVKDGEVSFTVVREFNNQKMTSKYKGKLEGDTIKGSIETERNGQTNKRDWEAKRVKE